MNRSLTTLGMPIILFLGACSNPAVEMYEKPVEQGQEAINKARDLQQKVNDSKSTLDQQEKAAEGTPKSP
jgi:predicted ATP-binding protein involved in virulence